jgi:hypothetical protein
MHKDDMALIVKAAGKVMREELAKRDAQAGKRYTEQNYVSVERFVELQMEVQQLRAFCERELKYVKGGVEFLKLMRDSDELLKES